MTESSGAVCWWPVCELSNAEVAVTSHAQSDDGSSFIFDFTSSVESNKADWCTPQAYTICVAVKDGTSKWCGPANTNSVVQTGAFGTTDFDVTVAYTSNNASSSDATVPFSWTPDMNTCRFNYLTSVQHVTDNLHHV